MNMTLSILLLCLFFATLSTTHCIALKDTSSVYMGTQALSFCGKDQVIQGRWDGSFLLSNVSSQYGMVSFNYGTTQGVEAVGCMDYSGRRLYFKTFTQSSFLAYTLDGGKQISLEVNYDKGFGMINAFLVTDSLHLITGHTNGSVLVWNMAMNLFDVRITLLRAIDVSSDHPVFTIRNIRAIKQWKTTIPFRVLVVTASEDGDVCVVDILSGLILARQRYDAAAERGINDIDVIDDVLVLGNCATENSKSNMYLFQLLRDLNPNMAHIVPRDKLMLPDASGERFAFNFNVGVGKIDGTDDYYWAASVQGGLVYHGTLVANGTKLQVDKEPLRLVCSAAAALTTDGSGRIAVAADDSVRVMSVVQ